MLTSQAPNPASRTFYRNIRIQVILVGTTGLLAIVTLLARLLDTMAGLVSPNLASPSRMRMALEMQAYRVRSSSIGIISLMLKLIASKEERARTQENQRICDAAVAKLTRHEVCALLNWSHGVQFAELDPANSEILLARVWDKLTERETALFTEHRVLRLAASAEHG